MIYFFVTHLTNKNNTIIKFFSLREAPIIKINSLFAVDKLKDKLIS